MNPGVGKGHIELFQSHEIILVRFCLSQPVDVGPKVSLILNKLGKKKIVSANKTFQFKEMIRFLWNILF